MGGWVGGRNELLPAARQFLSPSLGHWEGQSVLLPPDRRCRTWVGGWMGWVGWVEGEKLVGG